MSTVNEKLAALLRARGIVFQSIDLSPGRWRSGAAYHLTRIARAGRGVFFMLAAPGRHRYVMSVDSGMGLAYNIALALAARLTGQAMLLYHHSTRYVLTDSRLMRLLLGATGRGVPHVFCSEKMASLFRQRYGATGPVMIVNNAAWVDRPASVERRPGDKLRLGFLSNLIAEKGYATAIDTLRAVRGQGCDAQLVMAGAPVDPHSQEIVAQATREFGPNFVYHGPIESGRKAAFYASVDTFLFPSLYRHETQSLVVPEALAAGVPVIAYDHRFVAEVLGEGGLLVAPVEPFAERAASWILAGQDPGISEARRRRALAQFQADWEEAQGQVNRLLAWASGN